MDSIAVYCGSRVGDNPRYASTARALGAALAAHGYRLVYGGGTVGLMGEVADAALTSGGEVVGVMPTELVAREIAHAGLTRLEVVDTMRERKARMEQLAEAFIALPGGIGTFEELTEVLTLQQLGRIRGPIALLDVDGYWQPFVQLLQNAVAAGFVDQKYVDALIVNGDPEEMIASFAQWEAPGDKWGGSGGTL